MTIFNLADDPWIPVRRLNGKQEALGLTALFQQAREIEDLVCAPHERVSIMRLLVCITQTVFAPPETEDDWEGYAEKADSEIPAYLQREDIHESFNLLGEGKRFLQVPVKPSEKPPSISKLIPHLATGNNTTLNDHFGNDKKARALEPPVVALALLTFQNFYPLYGAGYKGKGPCVDGNMLHTIVLGGNVFETVVRNCLTREMVDAAYSGILGQPIWEADSSKQDYESTACQSYLGRLVPRHRTIWLSENLETFHLAKESLIYPGFPDFKEPSATVVTRKKGNQTYLALLDAKLGRGIWRDLHLITSIREMEISTEQAPLSVQAHWYEDDEEPMFWLGALITDRKAKIYDTVESSLTVPEEMFQQEGRGIYLAGIEFAEFCSWRLKEGVTKYCNELKIDKPPKILSMRVSKSRTTYWHRLDQQAQTLIGLVRNGEGRTDSFGKGNDEWTRVVTTALVEAYQTVCPRQTPRQHKAYAAGLKKLKTKSSKPSNPKKNA